MTAGSTWPAGMLTCSRSLTTRKLHLIAGSRPPDLKIAAAFADAFASADGRVAGRTQTGYVLRETAARELAEAIRPADCHLTTGFVGLPAWRLRRAPAAFGTP